METMKVGIFYSSISNIHKSPHKEALMDGFRDGVKICGDEAVEFRSPSDTIPKLDAGFILGYTLENNYRKRIIDTLKIQKAKIIFVDSNIFSYGRSSHFYHRYSVNSVYPTDGEYFLGDERYDSKLNDILTHHKLLPTDWRKNGSHILVLGQRTLSWNMPNQNGLDWIVGIVKRLKKITDRKIIVRLHPGDKGCNIENRKKLQSLFGKKAVSTSDNDSIRTDLTNAWCSVGFNSTSNCVSVIQGIPVYLDDPLNSWAYDVGFDDINLIETPVMIDRKQWLDKIAHIHWSNDEISSGKYWRRFKNYYLGK
jgi:hypothetical protein